MAGPYDPAIRATVAAAVTLLAFWIEQGGALDGYGPEQAAEILLVEQVVRLVSERRGPVGVYILARAFAAAVRPATP